MVRKVCSTSFELNGIRREVKVADPEAQKYIVKVPMADPEDKSQVGASIPGAVSNINVKVGERVEEGQTVIIIEAMKMETAAAARINHLPLALTVSELAEVLNIGRSAAYTLVHSDLIRVIRIGNSIRIPRSALVEYLDKQVG